MPQTRVLLRISGRITKVSPSHLRALDSDEDAPAALVNAPRKPKGDGRIAWPRVRISMACGEPDPPKWWHVYFGTHPTLLERIEMAEAWEAASASSTCSRGRDGPSSGTCCLNALFGSWSGASQDGALTGSSSSRASTVPSRSRRALSSR